MKLIINPEVLEQIPGIQVGVIVLRNLSNQRKFTTVDQLLRGVCAQKKNELKNEEKAKKINSYLNRARVGNKVLPEAQLLESSIRKIVRSRPISNKNNLHELIHYLGIKHMVPVFAYDLDQVEKDLEINFIETKKGKRPVDMDIAPETLHAVFWFINMGSQTKEDFAALPEEFVNLIGKYCGGTEAELHFLDTNNTEVDLGYESEKEKVYLEAQFKQHVEDSEKATETDPGVPPFLRDSNDKSQNIDLQEHSIKEILAQMVLESVNAWLTNQGHVEENLLTEVDIETPNDPANGDYSTNVALKLGKQLGKVPHELAEALITATRKPDFIEKMEVAGPGFINFYLSENHLKGQLEKIIQLKGNYGKLGIGIGKKVLVEYSSPNIAKPLGVHHLLSTIIGQTLADLYRFAGYETVSLNFPGDWGTQFGKLLYAYKEWGEEEVVKKDPLNELLKLYVKFHDEEEKEPEFVEKGREEFKKLEEGDEENNKIWQWFKDVSIEELERIYKKLGVSFDEYLGERMYLEEAKKIVQEGKEKGIIEEGERGAMIVKFENDKYPPYMLQKADGTTLYATRDLASVKDRAERFRPDKSIYVVDVAQKLALEQLFETARKFGWGGSELKHVIFGRMQMPEGKMSTRKGDIILLDEVIKEAVNRTTKIVEEKSRELSEEERQRIAQEMAISAIKYNIISQNPETNILFEWDKILTLDGNSGPYLQYAYARAHSILRKSQEKTQEAKAAPEPKTPKGIKNDSQTSIFSITKEKVTDENSEIEEQNIDGGEVEQEAPFSSPTEQKILHILPRFPEIIESAVNEYKPNLLCTYLFELAKAFSSFYNEVHVLSAESEEVKKSRLKLVEAVAQTLQNGLKVLGIAVFERM